MAPPRSDRKVISFRISAAGLEAVRELAKERKEPVSETLRCMLRYAARHQDKLPPSTWKDDGQWEES